jgi:hypothetical protein
VTLLERVSVPLDGIPAWAFVLRVGWIAVELMAVVCLGQQGVLFFYQAF